MTGTTSVVRQGPLAQAQVFFWQVYRADPEHRTQYNAAQRWPVPAGVSVATVQAAVDELIRRHESLRTSYSGDDGEPQQLVHAPQPVRIEPVEAADRESARAVSHRVHDELRAHEFELEREPPLRVALVTVGTEPVTLVAATHHIAMDGWGWMILRDEFVRLLAGEPLPELPNQPLDQAEYEHSERGRKAVAGALAYWDRQLAVVPPRTFGGHGQVYGGHHQVSLESPALDGALRSLRRRLQATDADLTLAGYVALLGAASGHETCAVMMISSNRFVPRTRNTAACLAQPILVTVNLAGDPSFEEVVRRTRSATLLAYRHGSYDHAAVKERERCWNEQRGVTLSLNTYFNFAEYRMDDGDGDGDAPAAPADSRLSDGPIPDFCGMPDLFMLTVKTQKRTAATLVAAVTDLPPADMVRFVQGWEALLLRATDDPGVAGLSPLPPA